MNGLLFAGYVSLFAADGATTHAALRQGNVVELNMTQSPAANDALVAAQAAGLWLATQRIRNPWARWSIRLGVAALHGAAAVHNARLIK